MPGSRGKIIKPADKARILQMAQAWRRLSEKWNIDKHKEDDASP